VVAIVGLVIFLIVAAFLVGGTALNALQWLQPKIGEAIAVLKQQEARQLQIQNDNATQDVRAKTIENDKREQLARLEVQKENQKVVQDAKNVEEWSKRWQEWTGALIVALSNLLFWAPMIFLTAALIRWVELPQILPQVVAVFAGGFHAPQLPRHTSISNADTQDEEMVENSAFDSQLIARKETDDEKERHHAERQRARQRERDERMFALRRIAAAKRG
jgi:hypothetical protein